MIPDSDAGTAGSDRMMARQGSRAEGLHHKARGSHTTDSRSYPEEARSTGAPERVANYCHLSWRRGRDGLGPGIQTARMPMRGTDPGRVEAAGYMALARPYSVDQHRRTDLAGLTVDVAGYSASASLGPDQ